MKGVTEMSNYSFNPGHCLLSRFKPCGKWYDDIQIDMYKYYNEPVLIHDAVLKAYLDWCTATTPSREDPTHRYFTLVVMEPYHRHAHPVMIHPSDHDEHRG